MPAEPLRKISGSLVILEAPERIPLPKRTYQQSRVRVEDAHENGQDPHSTKLLGKYRLKKMIFRNLFHGSSAFLLAWLASPALSEPQLNPRISQESFVNASFLFERHFFWIEQMVCSDTLIENLRLQQYQENLNLWYMQRSDDGETATISFARILARALEGNAIPAAEVMLLQTDHMQVADVEGCSVGGIYTFRLVDLRLWEFSESYTFRDWQ